MMSLTNLLIVFVIAFVTTLGSNVKPVFQTITEGHTMLGTSDVIMLLSVKDIRAARKFYEKDLGLKFIKDDGFAHVFDANGIMLRISEVPNFSPAPYSILGWKVEDIHLKVQELSTNRIKFERYEGIDQDGAGVATFPNGDKVAWFKDPDENTLSIVQFK